MAHIVRENILFVKENRAYLFNLFNFRRMQINLEEFNKLLSIKEKDASSSPLDNEEINLLNYLVGKKQVLSSNVKLLDQFYEQESKSTFQRNVRSIVINLTYQCNFNCTYCYQRKYENRKHVLNRSAIDNIAKFLNTTLPSEGYNTEIESLVISGGEPLLDSNVEIINYILSKFGRYQIMKYAIYTNGLNILKFKNVIDFNRFSELQISLDGTDEIIKKINKSNISCFNQIIEGVKYLLDLGKKIKLVCILTNETINNLPFLVKELTDSGILTHKDITMSISHVIDFDSSNRLDSQFYEIEKFLSLLKEVKEIIKGTKIRIDPLYELSRLINYVHRERNVIPQSKYSMCNLHFSIPLLFGADGKVYWCSCQKQNEKVIGEFSPNISINSVKLEEYVMSVNSKIFEDKDCRVCLYRYVCLGGCPNHWLEKEEKGLKCGIFKDDRLLEAIDELL